MGGTGPARTASPATDPAGARPGRLSPRPHLEDELVAVQPVALVDAAGHTLTPVPPVGPCGKPLQAFLQALQKVAWQDESAHKVKQLVTSQAQTANCPMQWKNELWLAGQPARHASGGGLHRPLQHGSAAPRSAWTHRSRSRHPSSRTPQSNESISSAG